MALCPHVCGWLPVWRHRGREAEHVPGGIWSAHLLPFPRSDPIAGDRNFGKLKSEEATTGPERHRYPRWRGVAAASHRVRPTDGFLGIQAPKRPRSQRSRAGRRGRPEHSSSSDSDLSDSSWDSAVSPPTHPKTSPCTSTARASAANGSGPTAPTCVVVICPFYRAPSGWPFAPRRPPGKVCYTGWVGQGCILLFWVCAHSYKNL